MSDSLTKRAKGLEDVFFARKNQELLSALKEKQDKEAQKKFFADNFAYLNDSYIDSLLSAGVRSETFAALTLIPLVQVAWADNNIDEKEKLAIVSAAEDSGLKSDALKLLSSWLQDKPEDSLFTAWKDYVSQLKTHLNEDQILPIREDVLAKAEGVAAAAGGFLGVGSISGEEKNILKTIAETFN